MTHLSFTRPALLADRNIPIWLLITGNLRSGHEFRRMMEQALEIRSRGMVDAIRLVTWTGELEQAPGLEEALVSAGISILIVEPPLPNPKIHPLFHTYIYHQRKALHFGLHSLPPDVFVLKARTDFAEERFDAMTATLFGNGGADLDPKITSPLLQTRLFTYDARPDFLFYWDDIVFCGMRNDLLKLNNFDLSFDLISQGNGACAEIRLFSPLFLKNYPILQWFFENVNGMEFSRLLQLWSNSTPQLSLPALVTEILASYFHILSRYLLLPGGNDSVSTDIRLDTFFGDDISLGLLPFKHPWPSTKLVNQTLLNELLRLTKSPDENLNKIVHRMRLMDSDPSTRGHVSDSFEDLIKEFTKFSTSFQSQPLHTQARLVPEKNPATTSTPDRFLNSITMPEKRHLSRWQQKKLGLRKKLAHWLLKKCL